MARKPNDVQGVFEKNPGSGIWYVRYRTSGKYVKKKVGSRTTLANPGYGMYNYFTSSQHIPSS